MFETFSISIIFYFVLIRDAHVSTNSIHQGLKQGMLAIQTASKIASLP